METMKKKSVREIREEFERADRGRVDELCARYENDGRAGVAGLIRTYRRRREKEEAELLRMEHMLFYERKYADFDLICGVDEAGRGPLAGPVAAGAVILPKDMAIPYLDDSKKLSPKKREELYDEIMELAVGVGVGLVGPKRIDQINILQATYEAMRQAIGKLPQTPDLLLNDAVTIPGVPIRQTPIVKGDAKSMSIAAASVIAKVTRDRLMVEYDKILPEYGFAKHKGYGSAEHIAAIRKYGPSPIHRMSFIGKFLEPSGEKEAPDAFAGKRGIGRRFEQEAGRYLEEKGYRIVQYNYRCPVGEIDIIARDRGTLVFCEVKYRGTEAFGSPFEAVGASKQRTIARCAQYYLAERGIPELSCRFDVIGISPEGIAHIPDAFAGQ